MSLSYLLYQLEIKKVRKRLEHQFQEKINSFCMYHSFSDHPLSNTEYFAFGSSDKVIVGSFQFARHWFVRDSVRDLHFKRTAFLTLKDFILERDHGERVLARLPRDKPTLGPAYGYLFLALEGTEKLFVHSEIWEGETWDLHEFVVSFTKYADAT